MPFKTYEPGAPVEIGSVPLCVPHLTGREWDYVRECIDTNMLSSVGPFVRRFEGECAARVNATHGVATVTGTAALHAALVALAIGAGDEVLVSSLTFIAPVNAIRYTGAVPVFIDAEPSYWQIDPTAIERFCEHECVLDGRGLRNKLTGRSVKAIVPVHILGHPVDMDAISAIATRFGLRVIEDATESLGATYRGRPVGSLGDIGCFSFNGNKLITTGGGGMVVSNDEAIAARVRYLTTQAKDDPLEFVHGAIGFNYRMTNVAAAIGCAQLGQLDSFIAAKRDQADRYSAALCDVPGVELPREADWAFSVKWLYTILLDEEIFGMSSRQLIGRMADAGIQTRPLWQPAHRSPAHADLPYRDCPIADDLNRRAISLPSTVGLPLDDQNRVIDLIVTEARGHSA